MVKKRSRPLKTSKLRGFQNTATRIFKDLGRAYWKTGDVAPLEAFLEERGHTKRTPEFEDALEMMIGFLNALKPRAR